MVRRVSILCGIAVLAVIAATGTASSRSQAGSVSGAGSTFVFPLVSQWSAAYESATGVKVNYNPVGSGAGIQAITNRQVDFGASDAPLSPDQAAACKGCVQIPWALSATSVPYNVSGAPYGLKITGRLLADIFLGNVKKWNDPKIKKLNPGVNLPSTDITPIYRSDSSGTTYNFTEYLSHISSEWRSRVGKGTQVSFPAGVGARGSSGVAGSLSHTDGGITYVDVAYSLKSKFKLFRIRNRAGRFALPGIRGIQAAAATIRRVPANNEMSIVDPPKSQKSAYPICTFTYAIVALQSKNATNLKKFIGWALTKGQSYGPKLLFVPIPKVVRTKSQKTLKRVHA
ncbi:MAG: phosphate ABC transporter substrate-binding protein PstS [Actinomycetota bacterium]